MPRERKYNTDKPGYEAVKEYRESKQIKRVPLDMPQSDYDELRQAASVSGESVNGFIKRAIRELIDREATRQGLGGSDSGAVE